MALTEILSQYIYFSVEIRRRFLDVLSQIKMKIPVVRIECDSFPKIQICYHLVDQALLGILI